MLTKKSSRKMHTNLNKYQITRGKPSRLTGTKFNVPIKSVPAGQVEISSGKLVSSRFHLVSTGFKQILSRFIKKATVLFIYKFKNYFIKSKSA